MIRLWVTKSVIMKEEIRLVECAKFGDIAGVESLIADGVDINTVSCSSFPLFEAVSSGNIDLVKLLLDVQVIDINRYEKSSGYTCLHAAIFSSKDSNDNRIIRHLLQDKRIDLNARCRAPLVLGLTPFHLAAFIGNLMVIEELIKAGISLDDLTEGGRSAFEVAGGNSGCSLSNKEVIEAIKVANLAYAKTSV